MHGMTVIQGRWWEDGHIICDNLLPIVDGKVEDGGGLLNTVFKIARKIGEMY